MVSTGQSQRRTRHRQPTVENEVIRVQAPAQSSTPNRRIPAVSNTRSFPIVEEPDTKFSITNDQEYIDLDMLDAPSTNVTITPLAEGQHPQSE